MEILIEARRWYRWEVILWLIKENIKWIYLLKNLWRDVYVSNFTWSKYSNVFLPSVGIGANGYCRHFMLRAAAGPAVRPNDVTIVTNSFEDFRYQLEIYPSHISHNTLDNYPTIHHFVTEICTFLFHNGTLWDIGQFLRIQRNLEYFCASLMSASQYFCASLMSVSRGCCRSLKVLFYDLSGRNLSHMVWFELMPIIILIGTGYWQRSHMLIVFTELLLCVWHFFCDLWLILWNNLITRAITIERYPHNDSSSVGLCLSVSYQ